MKRLIVAITLGVGLLLAVLLPFRQSNAAMPPPGPELHHTSPPPASSEPAWKKIGSTLALLLVAEEQEITFSLSTPLGRIQDEIRAMQAVQVSVRFEHELTAAEVAALEQELGLEFHRLDGELCHVAAIYGVSVPLGQMAAFSQKPNVVQIELLNKPVAAPPLDVSIPLIGADQVWVRQDWMGRDIQGQGIRVANFDSGVDVYHPDFWRADGGTYNWIDANSNNQFDPFTDYVDLSSDSFTQTNELLGYFDATGTAAASIGTSGIFEADVDWLYNDANGNGQRDYGTTAGYTETQPTYGEQIFLVNDANLNNTLDVGESLIALGSSKVYATLDWQGTTHLRGTDLITSDADFNGHGTGVAGVMLGGNVINVTGTYTVPNRRFIGVAPGAELLSADRAINFWTTYIPWAANNGAKVMLYEFGAWIGEFMDGSSNLEQAIDAQAANGIVQVVPAGNLAGSNKEDTETIPAGGSHVFTATMPPLTLQSWAFMAFLWQNPGVNVTYTITAPYGSSVTLPATTGNNWGLIPLSSDTIWYRRLDSGRGTAKYDIWINASGGIFSGNWLIRADNPSGSPLTVYAYITDNAYQWAGGMVWANPNETRTVCWPTTANSAVTVGSYSTRAGFDTVSVGDLSSFSSRGSRVDGARALDIAAPGGQFEVVAAESRSSGASATGKYQWFGGTSAAGPHVAGTVALMLQKNPTLTPTQVISIIHATAITDTWTEATTHGGPTPNDGWGWGKLNVAGAVQNTPTPSPDFALVVTPTRQRVTAGQATTYTVGLSPTFGFTAPVTLSVGGLPSAVVASWSNNTITSSITGTLWITTAPATPPGDHRLPITGTGGGVTRTTRPTLTVLAPAFSISKTAASSVVAGLSLTYTIRVSNTGNVTATTLVITDALPGGANYVGCEGGTCGESGGTVTWSGLTVPANDTAGVTFVVTACTGPLVNSAYRVTGCAEGVSSLWGATVTTVVQAPNLVATFTPISVSVPPNTTVAFTDTSTTDGSPIVDWRWNFGDGGTGSGQVVSHTYAATGAYTVALTVTDTCGYSGSVQVPDAVKAYRQVFLPLVLRSHP